MQQSSTTRESGGSPLTPRSSERTNPSSRRMTGFPAALAMATGFAALGRCPHTAIASTSCGTGRSRKFLARLRQKFLQMRNTPDARRVNANHAFSASSCAIRARTFSRHAGVSTPGPVAATSNVRMLIPAFINLSCSSDSACSGMDSGNWL